MEIVLNLLLSVLGLVFICGFGYYCYLIENRPSNLFYLISRIENDKKKSYGIICIWFVVITVGIGAIFVSPIINVIIKLTGHVPEELWAMKYTFSGVIALLSIYLLNTLTSLAVVNLRDKLIGRNHRGINKVVSNLLYLKYQIAKHKEELDQLKDDDDKVYHFKDHCRYMVNACTDIQSQIDEMKSKAAEEAVKQFQDKLHQQKQEEEKKQKAEAWSQTNKKYLNALLESSRYEDYKKYDKNFKIEEGGYLLDEQLLALKLDECDKLFKEYIPTLKESELLDISMMFASLHNIKIREGLSVKADYKLEHSRGTTYVYAVDTDGKSVELADAIIVNNSVHGAIEGHLLIHMSLKYGNYDHGYYDRDYNFITSMQQFANIVQNTKELPVEQASETFKVPAGMRISKNKNTMATSMLAYFPNGTVIDTKIKIGGDGSLTIKKNEVLYKSKTVIFY